MTQTATPLRVENIHGTPEAVAEFFNRLSSAPSAQRIAAAAPETTASQAPAQTSATHAPKIGEPWLGQGGIYIGLVRGAEGEADYHLIQCPILPSGVMGWDAANTWATGLQHNSHTDFRLHTRRELSIAMANCPELFETGWFWTGEQCSRTDAWNQYFGSGGNQDNYYKSFEGRARAVRRFIP